jgi:hypothetical protein|tara:strand:- start:2690 stop:4282 length:1593 start_codon:yes stop_codon:yes gene_type:complete
MASGDDEMSLASRLADAEATVLFMKINEKRLSEENARYRERCETLSTQLLEAATPALQVAMAFKPPRAPDPLSSLHHEDRVLNLFLTDGKHLTERKVAGLVAARNGALEFGTVSASVRQSEFVGFRPLKLCGGGTADKSNAAPPAQKSMADRVFDMLNRGVEPPPEEGAYASGALSEDEAEFGASAERSARTNEVGASLASLDFVADGSDNECAPEDDSTSGNETVMTAYEIVWKHGGGTGPLRRLAFETNQLGLAYVKKQVKIWSVFAKQDLFKGVQDDEGTATADNDVECIGEDMRLASRLGGNDRQFTSAATTSTTTKLPLGPHPVSLSEPSSIFTPAHAMRLHQGLPARLRHKEWKMAYSSRRDGISLKSLYRAAAREARDEKTKSSESLLLVLSTRGHKFGAFVTEPWCVHDRYYGTGESFVFTIDTKNEKNETNEHDGTRNQSETKETTETGAVTKHAWSQANDYFMFGRRDCVAVGGGNGFALWLDEELLRGNSTTSDTFDNPCLSGDEKDFEIVYVELWTFA